VEDVVKFIWKCSKHSFAHPRVRLQLFVILFAYVGSRPEELIVSDAWKNSYEGLHYGDVELKYGIANEYTRLVLQIILRNRKGKSSNDSPK
jgi:hypothetical protein